MCLLQRKRGSGVDAAGREEMIEDLLIQSLQRPPAPLPPPPAWIKEERFLATMAPSLHRLPPQQRAVCEIPNSQAHI